MKDLARTTDQFWSDISRKRESLQFPSTSTRDIHTHDTQSLYLQSSVHTRTQNSKVLTRPSTFHSSQSSTNNSQNFQHSLNHSTKQHLSRTLNTSHSPASTLSISKTQSSRYSPNTNKCSTTQQRSTTLQRPATSSP